MLATLATLSAQQGPSFAPVFGDHGVLQRDKPLPVWGWAAPGESVAVTFKGQTANATAAADGSWSVTLGPFAASSAPSDLTASGKSATVHHDIVVGDVWLCSGQSNMEFVVDDHSGGYRVDRAPMEVATANFPMIRQLKVAQTVSTKPERTVKTLGWVPASPDTVGSFTAVGYFFARDIHKAVGVPIGIIDSPWGGTPIESWMSDAARAGTPIAGVLEERWKKALIEWTPERVARYNDDAKRWHAAEDEAKARGTKNPLTWPQPPATTTSPAMPGGLYNAMIAPLQPSAIRGILWYQGESNVGRADEYAILFKALITSWREGFGQGDLPFLFVQIANFGDPTELDDRGWPLLREAQAKALSLPATGMAVTIDIGEADNIHPRNKQEVGRRLALIARTKVYGIAPEVSEPVFKQAIVEGHSIRVTFDHAGGELISRGGPPRTLEIAGADKVFHPASGSIEGDALVVTSADVKAPVAVRYAWTNAPEASLYSDAGLPAVPFRSDSW
jgi:sialate O-acetylesterase